MKVNGYLLRAFLPGLLPFHSVAGQTASRTLDIYFIDVDLDNPSFVDYKHRSPPELKDYNGSRGHNQEWLIKLLT